MGQTVQPVAGWKPNPSVHAGYAYTFEFPFAEFDYVWVEAWNCVAVVLEVTNGGTCRVTDRLTNREGTARFEFFLWAELERV